MSRAIISALVVDVVGCGGSPRDREVDRLSSGLQGYGEGVLKFALDSGVRIRPLSKGERYREASPALARMKVDVDLWPTPPAGLFVVEERTVYARSRSSMTIAHEFGHAFDCALGGGIYHSGLDPAIRQAFANALEHLQFVTPYAATGLDEYFAEACRAWVGANDRASHWPSATKARLKRVDARMYAIVESLFAAFEVA